MATQEPTGGAMITAENPPVIKNQPPATLPNNTPPPQTNNEPTTVSNTTINEKIPSIKQKTAELAKIGVTVDQNGVAHYANGTIYQPEGTFGYNAQGQALENPNAPRSTEKGGTNFVTDAYGNPINQNVQGNTYTDYLGNVQQVGTNTPPAGSVPNGAGGYTAPDGTTYADTTGSYESSQIQKSLFDLKANTDVHTANLIDSIKRKYEDLINTQNRVNASQLAGLKTSMLMSGSYKAGSAIATTNSQIEYGLNEIKKLNDAEINAIAQAQIAGDNQDFQIQSKLNEHIEKIREEKVNAAIKLNENIATKKEQADKDNAIAEVYSKGFTDVPSIMTELKKNGVSITAKEVADTLTNIVPKGLNDLVTTLRQNGAPQDIISKVLSSKTMDDAYLAAGSYANGGTGIIGEYNYYKAQAEANGQVPMSFNEYQNEDANRKARVAAATTGGMTTVQANMFNSIVAKFNASPLMAAKDRTIVLKNSIDNINNDPSNGAKQLALVYSYVQALDTYQSAVREGELSLVNSIDSKIGQLNNWVQKVQQGQIIRPEVAKQIATAAQQIVDTIEAGAKAKEKQYESQAKVVGLEDAWKQYITGFEGNTVDTTILNENEAKNKVIQYGKENPSEQVGITDLVTKNDPDLGRPMTYLEALQYLKAIGKLK